jgi:hypothetical protein
MAVVASPLTSSHVTVTVRFPFMMLSRVRSFWRLLVVLPPLSVEKTKNLIDQYFIV